jgi:ribose transport system substrate-binding protein
MSNILIRTSRMLVGAALLLCFAFPAHAESSTEAGTKPLLYGVTIVPNSGFWSEVESGARKAGEEFGYDIIYRGAPQKDAEGQRKVFDLALESGAKGIFIAPNSADRDKDVVRARARGIPVVYFDRKMGNPDINSFIGTDNYAAGKLAAQELVKKAGKDAKLKVAVFRMDKDVVPTTEREEGFIAGAKEAGYEIVAMPYLSTEVGTGRSRLGKFLADPATPAFDAIFTSAEYTAVATILTLQGAGKIKDYIHIGFDLSPMMEKAIRNGELYGAIVQQPFLMGYYSVKALDDALQGRTLKPHIISDVVFVSKENVDTYNQIKKD